MLRTDCHVPPVVDGVQPVQSSQASLASGTAESYGLNKRLVAVKGNRTVTKRDMVHNAYLPSMQIDAQTYQVRADGVLLTCAPATVLPMAQKYFLF